MKKLALLGAARPRYEEKVKDVLKNKECEHCWTGWTYGINKEMLKVLDQQFKDKYFHLYYHDIKEPEDKKRGKGTGFVEYKLRIKEYVYSESYIDSPEPECTSSVDRDKKHRLYACTVEPMKITSQKWNTFRDYNTGNYLSGPFPFRFKNAEFGYIIDPYPDR